MSNHEIVIAQAVAQAQADSEFKAALLADPKKALASKGVKLPVEHRVVLLVDTATKQHVIVPTQPLPESQRVSVLPRDPSSYQLVLWTITTVQAGGPMADSLLNNPVGVLREKGVKVPQSIQVSVHRNTDSTTHIAIPHEAQADQAEGELSEERLDSVVGGISWFLVVKGGKPILLVNSR